MALLFRAGAVHSAGPVGDTLPFTHRANHDNTTIAWCMRRNYHSRHPAHLGGGLGTGGASRGGQPGFRGGLQSPFLVKRGVLWE